VGVHCECIASQARPPRRAHSLRATPTAASWVCDQALTQMRSRGLTAKAAQTLRKAAASQSPGDPVARAQAFAAARSASTPVA
jgi:hypothetical protein